MDNLISVKVALRVRPLISNQKKAQEQSIKIVDKESQVQIIIKYK